MKKEITKILSKVSTSNNFKVEATENEAFGDYSTNIALLDKNSREMAEEIVSKLKKDNQAKKLFEKIEVAGPGFINFWLKEEFLKII